MKSLAHIFRDMVHHHERAEKSRASEYSEQAHYLPLSEQARNQQAPTQPTAPSRQDVLNHLGYLADDYHLPRKLVYATAAAESDFDVNEIHENFAHDKHNRLVHDKQGNPIVKSVDYGLMQINGPRINHDKVKDSAGRTAMITDAVTRDWKANAEAGVAILKHNYDLIMLSEPPGASREDVALATYAAYNHGQSHWHKFLERDKRGVPRDGPVRNFYNKYQTSPER